MSKFISLLRFASIETPIGDAAAFFMLHLLIPRFLGLIRSFLSCFSPNPSQ